jgi:hypothetical protein
LLGILVINNTNSISKSKKDANTTYVVKFHINGCDDCTNVYYCIDGGQIQLVHSCVFTVDLEMGPHTICVHCLYGKRKLQEFKVKGLPYVQDEDVEVSGAGDDCSCTNSKQ